MLTQWTLGNFKAIDKTVTLELAPVTVLAGANSSGKSSVLQSILLVAQTLRAKPGEQPVLLNGEYVRLGYISDLVHNGNTHIPVVLGFKSSQKISDLKLKTTGGQYTFPIALQMTIRSTPHSTEQMRAKAAVVEMAWGASEELVLSELMDDRLNLANPRFKDMDTLPEQRLELQQGQYQYVVTKSTKSFGRIEPYAIQVSLRHFLPFRILETYDSVTERARKLLMEIATVLSSKTGNIALTQINTIALGSLLDNTLREKIKKELSAIKSSDASILTQEKNRAIHFLKDDKSLGDWVQQVHLEINPTYRFKFAQVLRTYASSLQPRKKDIGTNEVGVRAIDLPADLRLAIDLLSEFFANNLYYVGPLRESPQYIYGLPPYPEVTHAGLKGEFTASVLEHFKNELIDYPLPPNLVVEGKTVARAPLAHALQVWLEHMGLLENVTTTDRGKMGTELTVKSRGVKRDLDLTSIGVGVSQVLPTLVTGLIAPRGTTFLLEQPELHLHPRVQSSLADFFLGLARVGKQCIVETHSEYLVNRLRRRVAEDESNGLAKQIQIYFVEREEGKAHFQRVDLNEYGAIVKWPKGFFDEGPSEADLIIDAAMRKLKKGS